MVNTALPTFHNLPQAKQDKVLEAALAEFADKGYEQASLNTMVAHSGIAKGSLYQYFKDKKGLFVYVFQFAIELVRRTLTKVKEDSLGESFFVRLEKSLLAGVEFIQRHPRIYGLYLKILFDQNVPRREELLQTVRQFAADYLGSLVRQGIERGELSRNLSAPAAIFLLDALLDRFLQAVALPAFDVTLRLNEADQAEVRQKIVSLIPNGAPS
jgi:AcrR family transcriptional regulator